MKNICTFAAIFIAIFTFESFSSVALSQSESIENESIQNYLDQYMSFLGRANTYSPLEGAGSHGTAGFSLGGGVGLIAMPETTLFHETELQLKEGEKEKSSFTIPRAYFVKGIFSPVDIAITAGSLKSSDMTQISGHLQWTIYEAFAMPALALRASYSKISGLSSTDFSSISSAIVTSYGFFRYFNAYAGIDFSKHEGRMKFDAYGQDQQVQYFLSSTANQNEYYTTWLSSSQFYGLQMHLFSPFYFWAAEMQVSEDNIHSYSAKLSIGM